MVCRCAPEALQRRKFDEKSDVWSYGVTVWEVFSFGETPRLGELDQLFILLHEGQRLARPAVCTIDVFRIIFYGCWEFEAKDRKSFVEIRDELQAQLSSPTAAKHPVKISK